MSIYIRGKVHKCAEDKPVSIHIPEYNIIISNSVLGEGVNIWSNVNIYGAIIGKESKIGAFVEIRKDVFIGVRVKIEPFVFIPEGVTIESEVFIGPSVTFTNDVYPASVHADGSLITEYEIMPTVVKRRASIGAGSTILCGVTIGENALIGLGTTVVSNVPDRALIYGEKGKLRRFNAWQPKENIGKREHTEERA
jgi:UDP-2-acetamido-3-amino-2,3-dideoxy-glucuronate N-acetyltransferase